MKADNVKDFTIDWITMGLLMVCLLGFVLTFTYHNNPTALGDVGNSLSGVNSSLSSSLVEIEGEASAEAETSDSFISLDSAKSSISSTDKTRSFLQSAKILIALVFTGAMGTILLSTLGAVFLITLVYLGIKWFRTGI